MTWYKKASNEVEIPKHKPSLCPDCGVEIKIKCRCHISDATCPNGHKSYVCPIHGRVAGDIDDRQVDPIGKKCICNIDKLKKK
ncbi:MAG: hypothetical protein AABY32_04435 [Nanoarchaeota archaeon]